jgi:hypothetical protein
VVQVGPAIVKGAAELRQEEVKAEVESTHAGEAAAPGSPALVARPGAPAVVPDSEASAPMQPRKPVGPIKRIKMSLKSLRHYARIASAASRPYPDVIITGAMRAGTTSLLGYLGQHPGIRRSSKKEIHYFDYHFDESNEWYRAYFPRIRPGAPRSVFLESSPSYLFHPKAPERLASVLDDVKLIALLRNPVERTLSHYFHEVRRGREPLAMLEAFEAEEERLAGEVEKISRDDSYPCKPHRYFSYKSRSVYIEQLRRWEPWLRSGQMRVVQSEDLYSEPARVVEELFEFIGVDPGFHSPDLRPRNVGGNREAAPAEVVEYLEDYFRPFNAELELFLGRRFGWDRN